MAYCTSVLSSAAVTAPCAPGHALTARASSHPTRLVSFVQQHVGALAPNSSMPARLTVKASSALGRAKDSARYLVEFGGDRLKKSRLTRGPLSRRINVCLLYTSD